ncbi:iron ABC transporter permease [Nitratireductor aquimarinus]|uniref:FecCD family ABC transporter permease n=1 Tax=Nitratireductor TaxID=245876 RepID=UPI0019D3BEFF|nr:MULTISPECIES: iron ABC transporter permease [Nitratireductor]MBN7778430.1 iron ABC transporter permease [Nitratireductor pacificus]MBN7782752.1 iron ABC transporter permease [Nitratireductor pacificus]MBN7791559.1 iron ABC transporter permease [Nitratireductor aquimarinus]MBY6100817.1 iron ABC transporter permease [Nitratireductor aquimarinus]MCA1261641.1 iron ABC transporter permease [Nitratireductor aquimarinus]
MTGIRSETAPLSGRTSYQALTLRRKLVLAALSIALVLALIGDIATGPASYGLWDVARTLIAPAEADAQMRVIVWSIRTPAALMAIVVGMALAIGGAQMQTILNNPLASPFTLGISAGASFGAALAIAFGVALIPAAGEYVVAVNAFVVAMATACLIHMASIRRGASIQTIVLFGIALVFSFNTALAITQYFANQEAVAAIVFWTMGSLAKATWPKFFMTAFAVAITLPIFLRRRWQLSALRLGEARAASFGIPVRRLRLETLILVSLLSAIPVAFVGTIGFVGLVGPHIARMMVGEDQRFLLPASALTGALIMSLSSILAKVAVPGVVLPIGIVTAAVGLPVFLYLILKNGREIW